MPHVERDEFESVLQRRRTDDEIGDADALVRGTRGAAQQTGSRGDVPVAGPPIKCVE